MAARRLLTRTAATGGAMLSCAAALALAPAGPSAAATASVPPCRTSGLVIWLDDEAGGGTAGSIYYKLELTNLSGHVCALRGYPGVSAVDLRGRRLGGGASREISRRPPRSVALASGSATLADGTTATAVLRILDAGAIVGCRPQMAAGLLVRPPGQTLAKVVPFPFEACTRARESNLTVGALAPQG